MTDNHSRLKEARLAAGFETAASAAKHFGWNPSTYAGHENGFRGYKLRDAEKYADAFSTTADWLLLGTRPRRALEPESTRDPRRAGFSEPDVSAYHPPTDRARTALAHITAALGTSARHPTSYRLNRSIPGLFMIEGDVLVCDLNAKAAPGQVVLVQIADEATAQGETRLFLATETKPVPPFGEQKPADTSKIAIIGVAIGLFRSLPLAA